MSDLDDIIKQISFDKNGLIPVIVQDSLSRDVLMMAWMNEESLKLTLSTRDMTYYSRSRRKIWRKGEVSGQTQRLQSLRLDCDGDCLLAKIEQKGVACHTGHYSCFYRDYQGSDFIEIDPILKNPKDLYKD